MTKDVKDVSEIVTLAGKAIGPNTMTIAKGVGEMMADSAMTTVKALKVRSQGRLKQAERDTRKKIDEVSKQIKNTEQFKKMKKGLQEKTDVANKFGKKARHLSRTALEANMHTWTRHARLQGRQFSDSLKTRGREVSRIARLKQDELQKKGKRASTSDLRSLRNEAKRSVSLASASVRKQGRGLARRASAFDLRSIRNEANRQSSLASASVRTQRKRLARATIDDNKSRGARGTFSKLNDMQRRAGVKMAKGITKGISNKYNAANRAQRKFAKETGDKVKNNPGLLKAKDTIKKVTKPVGKALSPITKPTGAAIKLVGKTGKQGVMGVARTGKGTVGRSIKIMKNLGTSYKDSFKSTTNVTRNLAQSARSATRQSAVGNAAREFSRVVKQREAKVKRGSLAGQSTKGLYRQPSQYGKLLKIKTARNLNRFAETPGAFGESLHAVNKAMYGNKISSASKLLGRINRDTIKVLRSPKKLLRKRRSSDKTKTYSLRSDRSKHRQQINQDSIIKKERETKSQGEIALSTAADKAKEALKSFNEHRNLLRKGSIKNTSRKVSSQDNSNNKIKSTIQSMLHLINSSDDKDALKGAMLTLAGVSNQSSVDRNLLSKLEQLIGEKNIQILKNLKKIP